MDTRVPTRISTLHPVSLISPPPQLRSQAPVEIVGGEGKAASENGRIH